MKQEVKSQSGQFDALFAEYIRQMSKRHRVPKELEHRLLQQATKRAASSNCTQ